MSTDVVANQGGCTVWCNDCKESHNYESWSQERTLRWLKEHGKVCKVAKKQHAAKALRELEAAGAPRDVMARVRAWNRALKP